MWVKLENAKEKFVVYCQTSDILVSKGESDRYYVKAGGPGNRNIALGDPRGYSSTTLAENYIASVIGNFAEGRVI